MIWGIDHKIKHAQVVSFDIFDTCVYRSCPPKDVHLITGARLAANGMCVESALRFWNDRIEAEQIANAVAWSEHRDAATLQEIYNRLPVLLPTWVELDVEWDVIRPNPEVHNWYQKAVSLGKQIVFSSDMYLPSGFLGSLLNHCGYNGMVYVSCEVGCKTTGRLWTRLLTEFNVQPRHVLHIGDHLKGDVLMPTRFGIKTQHYRRKRA